MLAKKPTCFELRAGLAELKVSYEHFGRVCGGVSFGTVVRWCEGRLPIPGYAWAILSLMAGISHEEIARGRRKRFEVGEDDVFPDGFSRDEYLVLMRRFHPDTAKKLKRRRRDFIGEVQLLNEIKERYRQQFLEAAGDETT